MPKSDDAPLTDPFADLTWSDLEQWVGSRSLGRGQSYQKKRRVLQLARISEDALAGRVVGTALYTTRVSRHADDPDRPLSSTCSCPLGGNCKHGVAVVVEYLERLKAGRDIPEELPDLPGRVPDPDGDLPDEEDLDDGDDDAGEVAPRRRSKSRRPGKVDLTEYLQGLTESELVELVTELAETSEETRRLLETRVRLADGRADEIVRAARSELRRVASEHGWRDSWSANGHTPNYSLLTKYLDSLLAAGHPDPVLELGREILRLGTEQVGMSDDEGETAMAVTEPLDTVWEALKASSLSPAARILWAYDRFLEDDYDLCDGADEADFWEAGPEVWSEVADVLVERLGGADGQVERDLRYRRSRIAWWTVAALQKAGRRDEAVALAVSEATVTHDYDRAVDLLIETGRGDEARALALEGIKRTQATLPGISARLRSRLLELAVAGGDPPLAAAFRAEEFDLHPSLEGYRSLREAAQRAGVWDRVRECVLASLRECSPPVSRSDWPLPPTGTAPEGDDRPRGPRESLLTEIALDEGDHAEALKWHRRSAASGHLWGSASLDARVAREVASTHPDESIAIWRRLAEGQIARGNRGAYEESLRYLRPMQALLRKLGRQREWDDYLVALREEHRRKRALLETLGRLSDRRIVEE